MNINNHTLEIMVNGVPVDMYDEGVNLRINKVINDPTKINTTQAEYSFTFNLPITSKNSKIFNYANISSKSNKFSGRFKCDVYADSIPIFEGTIKVSEVSEGSFKCNLFKTKVNTLESIFGESTMNEINWKVPFKGISTINEVNEDLDTKYFFPLVAYSLFNKVPETESSSGYRKYTEKTVIDNTNKFYFNSFVPSLNLVELLKKCCELKGYELNGDILSDRVLNDIYLSNYIGDEQDPLYNYGDPDMGELSFDISFKNYTNDNDTRNTFPTYYIDYMLAHPIPYPSAGSDYGNYTNFLVYNLLDKNLSTISNVVNESKLLVDGGIQIPADGWYEITLNADFGVSPSQATLTDVYECTGFERASKDGNAPKVYEKVSKEYSLFNMPLEIQLIKYNADDGDVESISHDLIYKGDYPNEYVLDSQRRKAQRTSTSSERTASRASNARPVPDRTATSYTYTNVTGSTEGQSVTTAVDPYNNPNFICGLSQSNWSRSVGYIKNGYSWNYDYRTHTDSLYNCNGYYYYTTISEGNNGYLQSTVNKNTLIGATATNCIPSTNRHSKGECKIIIKLAKNDMLVPYIQNRAYYDENDNVKNYMIEATATIKVRAVAPDITSKTKLTYNMNSLFDKDLNLGNFNNKDQKISEFINDVQKAFNLSFQEDGNKIILNKQKISNSLSAPIDMDYKANTNNALFNAIDFPRSIEIKYKIDTEEEGFYRSVEDNTTEEQMQSNNWKDYGDYGYEKVNISQADDATDLNQQLNFSYCWYQDFNVTQNDQSANINIPIIGKTEWWIEGLDYETYSQYDGRGMTQRMWFRGEQIDTNLKLDESDTYNITTTSNYKQYENGNIVYLNYNNGINTLLGKYFNIDINSASDEVEIEVYLTPMEYKQLSMGSSVHFDDNIYKVLEIQGYDATGINPTKLKLISI